MQNAQEQQAPLAHAQVVENVQVEVTWENARQREVLAQSEEHVQSAGRHEVPFLDEAPLADEQG